MFGNLSRLQQYQGDINSLLTAFSQGTDDTKILGSNFMKYVKTHSLKSIHLFGAMLLVLLINSTPSIAADFKPFQPNPSNNQNDYFSSDLAVSKRVRTVEHHHWEKARQHKERGAWNYAFDDIDFMLRYVPNHPHALMQMSEIGIAAGQPDTARRYLDYAIQYRPKNVSSHVIYGIHLHRTGHYQEAVEHYTQALKLDPTASETHYNLGLSYVELKQYKLAQEHAQIAYDKGYPLSGLKDKLKQLGHWQTEQSAP
jgi:tetratricopeptide (TPR) repeat protein